MIKIITTALLASIVLTTSGFVSANVTYFSGALCQPNSTNDASKIGYTGFGVHNVATTGAGVSCPGQIPPGDNVVVSGQAVVFDRHPTVDVCCTLLSQGADGTVVASMQVCSDKSGGPSQTLNYFFPFLLTASQAFFSCSIPGATSSGVSHVTSYRIVGD
ncbi:MAG TPA: hypothetical protein VI072_04775 [Polyangiaceae bacterium]